MLSHAQVKYIRSLQEGKFRLMHNVYIVEGEKMAAELLQTVSGVKAFYGLKSWVEANNEIINKNDVEHYLVTEEELKKISGLATPNHVLAVVQIPDSVPPEILPHGFYVALDNLQDPGNLGTIIRTADWFGFKGLICSENTVDAFNPKVVQATMGSILHVPVWYRNLVTIIVANPQLPVMAATLNGENVYTAVLPKSGILLIGNEGKGISNELLKVASMKLRIPQGGQAESLNAGVASGILMALLKARELTN